MAFDNFSSRNVSHNHTVVRLIGLLATLTEPFDKLLIDVLLENVELNPNKLLTTLKSNLFR